MTASLDTLVDAAYVFADSFAIPRSGPPGKITDAELIALAVAQAVIGVPSDRQFLGLVGKLLPGWFPHLPDQSQYNRRLRRLTPWIATVQLGVAELVASGQVRLVDGTLLSCANYAGCAQQSLFAGFAGYGYCPSKSQWCWGMRLVLMSDRNGVPVGYDLTPANEREYEATYRLAQAHPGATLFADKGLWGADYQRALELIDIHLVTPDKHRLGERPPSEVQKSARPARDRKRLLQPQTPDAARKPPGKDAPRPRPTRRSTPARAHSRHPHQQQPGTPTPQPRRLRRPLNPHQASR
jgi:hypothetical protein